MIVYCPECHKKLRINASKYAGKKLSLACRGCAHQFIFRAPAQTQILVAHGEPEVCRTILEVCRQDIGQILTCSDAAMARQLLNRHSFSILLLDVALPGAFPFQLIEEIHAAGTTVKIILLPSVYNRTAYKRKPSSLYGADGYLELHHLSDQLIPLLQKLIPDMSLVSRPYCLTVDEGEERSLPVLSDVGRQAEEFARLLIADIALYHQDQIDLGIINEDIEERLFSQLAEGRQMLVGRIPQLELDRKDYLLLALKVFVSARRKELQMSGDDSHG